MISRNFVQRGVVVSFCRRFSVREACTCFRIISEPLFNGWSQGKKEVVIRAVIDDKKKKRKTMAQE